MLTSLQIVLLILIGFFLSRVYLRYRENVISTKTTLFWTIIWILAIIGVTQPGTTTKIASFFSVGRGVDAIIYIALALLFYLVFRIYVMIEDLRREITTIVRTVALKNIKKPLQIPSSKKRA